MQVTKLSRVPLDVPKYSVDTNAVSPDLDRHPALKVFNRFRTTLIVGQSGSGKSSLAVSLLISKKKKSRVFRKRAEHYIVFCPPNSLQSMENDPFTGEVSMLYDELTPMNLQEAYERVCEWSEKGERTVMYIDDLTQDLKPNEALLNIMSFNSRHLKLNIIITSQTLYKLPPSIRKNAATLVLFYLPNKREQAAVYDELLNIEKRQWFALTKYVYAKGQHNFLLIDAVNQLFFKNFDEQISFDTRDSSSDSSDEETDSSPKKSSLEAHPASAAQESPR
jgi:AAA15 family ATPase/GTPase